MRITEAGKLEPAIDGLILDVDGTLWDSTGVVAGAWTKAAKEAGVKNTDVTADRLKVLFGKTMSVIAALLFQEETEEKQIEVMNLCCEYEEQALEENEKDICYPEVCETIKELSKKVRIFIVSNCQSGYIELFMRKNNLEPFITDIECFGNNGNSKGENIRLLSERNGLKHPIYVGDTQGDCDACDEAGVPFLHVSYGFGQVDHCVGEIDHFSALKTLIG